MDYNDILRRIRYIVDFNDSAMMSTFALGGEKVSRDDVCSWLKKESDQDYQVCTETQMEAFLEGLIIVKRGKKEGSSPVAQTNLTNNIIFRKLKIALNMKAEEILKTMALADKPISKYELSAFFRKVDHKNFRHCKNQILRNFLKGLAINRSTYPLKTPS